MSKRLIFLLAMSLAMALAAGGAQAWVRARMFDANTPSGPQWFLLEKPGWPIENSNNLEEFRSGELNGPPGDKRISWRTIILDSSGGGKGKVRIDNIDNTKDTSILWSGCVFTAPAGKTPSTQTPALYIRIAAGSVKFCFNNDSSAGTRGWYLSEGSRSGGGSVIYGGKYGMAVDHGIWHKVRLTAYTDGTWKMWLNDASPIPDMWGNLDTTKPGNYVQWGAIDRTTRSGVFYTEYCYWGQGLGEIDPVPDPGYGEQWDIGGVSVSPSGNSATVRWYTEKATTINKVYYGDTFHTLNRSADATWVTDHWEAQLTGLDYSKVYTFYCESTDDTGQEYDTALYSFRTDADPAGTSQLRNPGFESGIDIYPWVDVFPPATQDDTQRWGRVYRDIDQAINNGVNALLPLTPEAFSGMKIGGTGFRKYGTVRQKVKVTPGKWYKATVKFQGYGNIPYAPTDMIGRVALDPYGHDAPGTLVNEVFTWDSDVVWGQAEAGMSGTWKTATAIAKAQAPQMSVFLQQDYNMGNSAARLAFDDVTFGETTEPSWCSDAKKAALGTVVSLQGVVVTARSEPIGTSDAVGYVEDAGRDCGIRVISSALGWDFGLGQGTNVNVIGTTELNSDREVQVRATSISAAPQPWSTVGPLAMNNRSLGGGAMGRQVGVEDGYGVNNIGLLVETWGRVTALAVPDDPMADFSVFIDDGSNLIGGEDGRTVTHPGIEVVIPSFALGPEDFVPGRTFVAVVGNSSTKLWDPDQNPGTQNSLQKRVLRVRGTDDVLFVIP